MTRFRLALLLAAGIPALVVCFSCRPRIPAPQAEAVSTATAAVMGNDALTWKEAFPKAYEEYAAALRETPFVGRFGGSEPRDKLEQFPELRILYAGSAFSKEYAEDRNHIYSWEDMIRSARVTEKTPASCMNCKTPDVADIFSAEGWAYSAKPLLSYGTDHLPISCANCHDPATKALRVIQPGFVDSLAERSIDFSQLNHREQSTMTCAQCHVEYYFEPGTERVIHPLTFGADPTEMYAYYRTLPGGFTGDFTNPLSGARLLKVQHPDYEEFLNGVHGAAGLSCADCHMPGGNHFIRSPLTTIESSCMTCHKGKTAEWLKARVEYNQNAVYAMQRASGESLAESHRIIGEVAARTGTIGRFVDEAREAIREGQWYYDFVASANSMGFHNPVLALESLGKALDLAQRSRELAWKAAGRL